MYNITKLWKRKPKYRMVTFPNETYGIERISKNGKEFLSTSGNWYSEHTNVRSRCTFTNAKEAADQLQWLRQEFPDAVIKEY